MMSQISLKRTILSSFLLFSMGTTLAGSHEEKSFKLLTPKYIKRILGPYPAKGSTEEAQDFEMILKFQENRTDEECALASRQEKATLKNLFVDENGPLTKREARRTLPRILKLYAESGINIYIAKVIFKRSRPYLSNPQIKPCVGLEKSYAYPSGHTAIARVFARILSRIYPERSEAFMRRADEVARNRILGGVHHPSDIEAGKKFGDILADNLMKSAKFLKDIEMVQLK